MYRYINSMRNNTVRHRVSTFFCTITIVVFAHASEGMRGFIPPSKGYTGAQSIGSSFIWDCMKKYNIQDYCSYFDQLSKSDLPYDVKITRELVMTPFFAALRQKTEQEKDVVYNDFVQDKFVLNYPLWRLFLAALWHAGIRDEGYIVCTAIENEDAALAEQLLAHGADATGLKMGGSALWYCNRVQEAQLLIKYGADVVMQHERNDLIAPICSTPDLDDDQDGVALMDFYLRSGVQLNERNNFGYRWFKILLRNLCMLGYPRRSVEGKLKLLWQSAQGSKRSINAVTKFLQKATCYPVVRQLLQENMVVQLHRRSLTGTHFTRIKPIATKRTRNIT